MNDASGSRNRSSARSNSPRGDDVHVAADDRTGALEVAAALADRGAGGSDGVPVAVWPDDLEEATVAASVVDLATRHLAADLAAERAKRLAVHGRAGHKIDSTLRGNWAAELAARHTATGRRVLLVPALPSLGRVCIDGVVLVDGRPADQHADARRAPVSARPADHLAEYGLTTQHLATVEETDGWLAVGGQAGVADAADQATIERLVKAWSRHPEVLLAGTSAVIASAFGPEPASRRQLPDGPALIVVGSLNPAVRQQVDAIVEAGAVRAGNRVEALESLSAGRHVVLATEMVTGGVSADAADDVADGVADVVHGITSMAPVRGCVIVIGGDTAAAVLGDERVLVRGSVAVGTAWVVSPRFRQPVITRAGGFGARSALVELLWGTLRQ
jgi:uncharacterized protein YgbK (DUF1537 family)